MKKRLDVALFERGLVYSRSQGESYIRLGKVSVDGKVQKKSGYMVDENQSLKLDQVEQYVSRAGLKLASVANIFKLDFKDKIVLDVGSSTGGFTDFALKHGAKKVLAVDVGTEQLHPSLRGNDRIELYEQTDIRDFVPLTKLNIILIDVSFISLREILPSIKRYLSASTKVVALFKPQFEVGAESKDGGVVKNDKIRRQLLKDFEQWVKLHFVIDAKADSEVAGSKGNQEKFYLLRSLKH